MQQRAFLRRERLDCTGCAARWSVRRIPGDGFYLRLDRPSSAHSMHRGQEMALAAWYDLLKSGLRLEAITHPRFQALPGEQLYLASRRTELWLAGNDPILAKQDITQPVASLVDENPSVLAGRGQVYLTSQRLSWQGENGSQDIPLPSIQGAHAIVNLGLAVTSGLRLVFFRFLQESPLKWVTYFSLLAERVFAQTGRRIETSHW